MEIIQETQGRERGRRREGWREREERTRTAQFQVIITVTHIFALALQSLDSLLEGKIILSLVVASSI